MRAKPTSPAGYKPYGADPDGGVPLMAPFGEGYRWHCTGLFHDESGAPSGKAAVAEALLHRLERKLERNEPEIEDYFAENLEDCDIAIISFGSSAMAALSAVRRARKEGIKAGMLRLKTIWPFPDEAVRRLTSSARTIIVPEMNQGQLVLEVERVIHGKADVRKLGKVNGDLFHPDEVFAAIKEAR